jgi:valyl-tRNA synthetase
MPLITEEIWQRLPHQGESILTAGWPEIEESRVDDAAESEMRVLMDGIAAVRNIRSEMNLSPLKALKCIISGDKTSQIEPFRAHEEYVSRLAGLSELKLGTGVKKPPKSASAVIAPGVTVLVPLGDMIDVEVEKKRLNKEIHKLRSELKRMEGQLADTNFVSKAPSEVVETTKRKREVWTDKVRRLEETLRSIQET